MKQLSKALLIATVLASTTVYAEEKAAVAGENNEARAEQMKKEIRDLEDKQRAEMRALEDKQDADRKALRSKQDAERKILKDKFGKK